ncbi:MAG: hypothetical protein U0802_11770 [Candidatus Binatia bacterium]
MKKLSIKLSFASVGNDAIKLTGTLPIPNGFPVDGARVVVDVGGVIKSFTLDAKGKAAVGDDKVALAVRAKGGVVLAQDAALSAKFKKGTFADKLVDEGLTNRTVSDLPVTVSVQVDVGPVVYTSSPTLTYTAKAGKTGKAK